MSFDQKPPGHPEVGVSLWHRQTHTQGHRNSMTESAQRADSVKIPAFWSLLKFLKYAENGTVTKKIWEKHRNNQEKPRNQE